MASFVNDAKATGHLVAILKALAHPARLRIVATLCRSQESVGALAQLLEIEPAIVSQQLRILRMQGLVDVARSEGLAIYSLSRPELKTLVACLEKCPESRGRSV